MDFITKIPKTNKQHDAGTSPTSSERGAGTNGFWHMIKLF
jgi:hypothetical protein